MTRQYYRKDRNWLGYFWYFLFFLNLEGLISSAWRHRVAGLIINGVFLTLTVAMLHWRIYDPEFWHKRRK